MMARGIGEGDSGVQRLDSSVLMSLAQRKEWLLQCIRESLCPNIFPGEASEHQAQRFEVV